MSYVDGTNVSQKIDSMIQELNQIKLSQVKHEAHQDRMNEILSKLTESVEYHIKRSDTLDIKQDMRRKRAKQQ